MDLDPKKLVSTSILSSDGEDFTSVTESDPPPPFPFETEVLTRVNLIPKVVRIDPFSLPT